MFWQSFLIWGLGSQPWTFSQQMWYRKKQEKLFSPYMSNSMLFSVPHENNGPLSKCKLFIDSHGISYPLFHHNSIHCSVWWYLLLSHIVLLVFVIFVSMQKMYTYDPYQLKECMTVGTHKKKIFHKFTQWKCNFGYLEMFYDLHLLGIVCNVYLLDN